MASGELLDNAFEYGCVANDVLFEILVSPESVTVRVSNRALASRIDTLRQQFARLEEDAPGTYEEEMTRSLRGTGTEGMLGLVRVRHEVGMIIDWHAVDERVTVTATTRR